MDISSEAGKTSDAILVELFKAFDAAPPEINETEENDDEDRKSKKSSKKSKKKHKKQKKRKRENSPEQELSHSQRKILKRIKKEKVSEEPPSDVVNDNIPESAKDPTPPAQEKVTENGTECSSNSTKEETKQTSSESDKKKKILIPNLINSAVFQETIKAAEAAEEEKRKKAQERMARYEEGEISDSDNDGPRKHNDKGERRHKKSHSSSRSHTSSKVSVKEYSRDERPRSSRTERPHSHHYSRDHRQNPYHRDDRIEDARISNRRSIVTRPDRDHSRSNRSHRKATPERHRRNSSEKIKDPNKIDKQKLLEIARRNAKKLISAGIVSNHKMVSVTSGGKSVTELTEYCKKISKREALGEQFSDVETGSSDDDKMFHHPFQVKDRPNSIVMNIRNATPLPVSKSMADRAIEQSKQLTLLFPVSSGSTHRRTESEWVPVMPPVKEPIKPIKKAPLLAIEAPPPPEPQPVPVPVPVPAPVPPPKAQMVVAPMAHSMNAIPPPSQPVLPVIQPAVTEQVHTNNGLDINDIVTKRLSALRKLQENPKDRYAKQQINHTQTQVDRWMRDNRVRDPPVETGEFRGSTGARILSQAELSSGFQAWAKRDQLITAEPVSSGMGLALLQKMGWQPGEGLGKNKEGTLEPLRLEVKTDKKGLVAFSESLKGKSVGLNLPTVKTLDGKHPVSLLNEYCTRRRIKQPLFELAFESGPDHKKTFLFKVKVNDVEYQPTVASVNKKQAKAEAAAIALRALGLISGPTEGELSAGLATV